MELYRLFSLFILSAYLLVQHHAKTGDTALTCWAAQNWGGVSSTISSGYFAPYYPMTNHPCFQLQLYIDSAAIVLCFSCNGISSSASPTALPSAFCHPFHVYIEALVPYQIDRVLILDCQARHRTLIDGCLV